MRNPCYHCGKRPASRHSNFCEECLPENRPLYFPTIRPRRAYVNHKMPLLTKLMLLVAIATTIICCAEAIKAALSK